MYISNTYSKVITWRSIDAVEAIRSNGGVVGYAAVLIDRLEGAVDTLKKQDIKLISVAKITDIIKVLLDTGILEEDILKAVRKQTKQKV